MPSAYKCRLCYYNAHNQDLPLPSVLRGKKHLQLLLHNPNYYYQWRLLTTRQDSRIGAHTLFWTTVDIFQVVIWTDSGVKSSIAIFTAMHSCFYNFDNIVFVFPSFNHSKSFFSLVGLQTKYQFMRRARTKINFHNIPNLDKAKDLFFFIHSLRVIRNDYNYYILLQESCCCEWLTWKYVTCN